MEHNVAYLFRPVFYDNVAKYGENMWSPYFNRNQNGLSLRRVFFSAIK